MGRRASPSRRSRSQRSSRSRRWRRFDLSTRSLLRLLLFAAAIALIAYADRQGWILAEPPDGDRYHLRTTLALRAIDGDTIEVALPDPAEGTETTRVRVWGIDCPEIAHPGLTGSPPAEPYGAEAAAFAEALVAGRVVTLRIEPQRTRDKYDRILAHVDLAGGDNLAEALLRAGLAQAEDRWSHSMLDRYRQLELQARRAGLGIWPPHRPPPPGG